MLIYIKDYDDDSTDKKPDYDQPFLINSEHLESVNVVYYRDTERYALKITTNSFEIPLRPFMYGQDIVSAMVTHARAVQAIQKIAGVLCEAGSVVVIDDYGVSDSVPAKGFSFPQRLISRCPMAPCPINPRASDLKQPSAFKYTPSITTNGVGGL